MKIFSIEGNIGSGKSTLINFLKESDIDVYYLPEPVDLWNEIKNSSGVTILEKYYQDQKKYAFSFQMMAYISRISQIKSIKNHSLTSRLFFNRISISERISIIKGNIHVDS